jgi:hypothetical protein
MGVAWEVSDDQQNSKAANPQARRDITRRL